MKNTKDLHWKPEEIELIEKTSGTINGLLLMLERRAEEGNKEKAERLETIQKELNDILLTHRKKDVFTLLEDTN